MRSLEDLVDQGVIDKWKKNFLLSKIESKNSMIITGPVGGGKTTLLNALVQKLNKNERIEIIERYDELLLPEHPYMLKTAVDSEEPEELINAIKNSYMKYKPDRIIVGEVRDKEVNGLVEASLLGRIYMTTMQLDDTGELTEVIEECASIKGMRIKGNHHYHSKLGDQLVVYMKYGRVVEIYEIMVNGIGEITLKPEIIN